MQNRMSMLFTSVAVGIVLASAALVIVGSEANAKQAVVPQTLPFTSNEELAKLIKNFQHEKPNAESVKSAITKVKSWMQVGKLRIGPDYFYAATIVAQGKTPEDALLAHDLAVCALAMGDQRAKPWIGISQDKFLTSIGREQRFGTQSKAGKIAPVTKDVPDSFRFILGIPSLLEGKRLLSIGRSLEKAVGLIEFNKTVPMPTATLAE